MSSLEVASTVTLPLAADDDALADRGLGGLVDDLDVDAGADAGGAAEGQLPASERIVVSSVASTATLVVGRLTLPSEARPS